MSEAISPWTARELVRHVMMYLDRRYPNLNVRALHTHDARWQTPGFPESQFWTEFYDDIVKRLPYVEGTEHKFLSDETRFD